MQGIQTYTSEIEELLETSKSFYQDLLGYQPKQTKLQILNQDQWREFIQTRSLNQNSNGIYLPRNQTAIIQGENPLSLFHEYFGHGLYCEQSLQGRRLVNLEKRLLEEEKQEFQKRQFNLKDLKRFRQTNQTFQELEELKEKNLAQYELFAIWTEYLLSEEHNLREEFGRKYDSLSGQEKEAVDSVIGFSEQYENLATFYAQGMAQRITAKRVKKLLEDIYKDKLQEVRFALLYGSRKEFSDIDVFMVGKNPREFHSNFLDVKMQSQRDLKKGIEKFDVRTLIPLMNGEIIFGDKDYFEKAKQKALFQPISEEAIKHNLKWSFRMQRLKDENSKEDFLRNKFEGYSQTYLANALALKESKRLFTKEDLLSYSQQEKLIQLKGGTEKNAT